MMRSTRPTQQPFDPLNRSHLAQLARLLAPFFLPASSSQPPTADPNATGGRVIAVTTKTQNKPRLQDATVLTLVGGELVWSYAVNFTAPPSVTATPQGPPPSAGATLYVVSPVGTNEVIVKSTDSSDTRVVHLAASQSLSGE